MGRKAKVTADAQGIGKRVFVRPKEVSELLDISERTVERMCQNREIDAIGVSSQWRIHREKLLRRFGIEEGDLV